ncbi:hypothetical protein C8J57DRAFT_1226877 [Mycena rebaudengoi]|nr:hypothetical protein C8J57DRAFT_1226877 [Mycena rebaudengoi]
MSHTSAVPSHRVPNSSVCKRSTSHIALNLACEAPSASSHHTPHVSPLAPRPWLSDVASSLAELRKRRRATSAAAQTAPPARRITLADTSNCPVPLPVPLLGDTRISSSLCSTDPQAAVRNVRITAVASLPQKRAQKPTTGNELRPSTYWPHVPANCRLLLWTAPCSVAPHTAMQNQGILLALQRWIFEGMLGTHVNETRKSYGAGLLRFHQFCDREGFREDACMPADNCLLAAFVADAIGSCTGKCIRNWLNGLHLWHLYNDVPWHGNGSWMVPLKKATDKVPSPSRTVVPSGAAHWAAALATFWGCHRLGEMLPHSVAKFTTMRDTCRSARVSRSRVNGRSVLSIHLSWTKTMGITRGKCLLTEVLGPDSELDPVRAWDAHIHINHSPPPNTPLFAFRSQSGWRHLLKSPFLDFSASVYLATRLELVFGHSYRIGRSLELLSAGVVPEVIMKLGGWSSLCFLIYWRRLEKILALAITRAWDARIRDFVVAHGHQHNVESLVLDE